MLFFVYLENKVIYHKHTSFFEAVLFSYDLPKNIIKIFFTHSNNL